MARTKLTLFEEKEARTDAKRQNILIPKIKKEKAEEKKQKAINKRVKTLLNPTEEEKKVPIKKRDSKKRNGEGILEKIPNAKPLPVILNPRSLQPNAPHDMSQPVDEPLWIKFFSLVSFYGGNVKRACTEMGISRQDVWAKEYADPAFKLRLALAKEQGCDSLEEEAIRRAYDGVEEPVGFFQGRSYETRINYSDTLLMFMMKSLRPEKYAERTRNENMNVNVEMTADEIRQAKQSLMNKLAGIVVPENPQEDPPTEVIVDEPGHSEERTVESEVADETPKPVTTWDVED